MCFEPISSPQLKAAIDYCSNDITTSRRINFEENRYILKPNYAGEYNKVFLMKTQINNAKKTEKINRIITLIALLISFGILALNFFKYL